MVIGAKRDLKKEAYWRALVRGRAGSGLTIREWCRKHGVSVAAFCWWRRELVRRDAEPSRTTFLPVRVVPDIVPESHGGIEILLSDGRRIRLHGHVDRQGLADVLSVLEAAPC